MHRVFKFLILFIFLFWALLFIALFHFSFPTYFVEVLPEIFYFLIFTFSCFGLGYIFLRTLKVETEFLERVVFSISIGLIIFSIFTSIAGFLGLLKKGFFVFLLFFVFIATIPSSLRFGKELREKIKSFSLSFNFEFLSFILLTFLMVLIFLFSLAPPLFYDSLEYHLAIPNYFILKGRITYMEGNVFSNMPSYLYMLYLFGILVKNEILASLINYLMGLILTLSLITFSRRFLFSVYSFIPSLSLLSLPLTSFLMSTPIMELPLSAFLMLSFYSLLLFIRTRKNGWLLITGIFAGFSAGLKYQGLFVFLLVPIVLLIFERRIKENIRAIIIIFSISIIVSLPWFLKNFIYTGNPFYPMFFKIFGGKGWSAENNWRFFQDLHIKSPSQMLSLLYEVNFNSKIFGAGGIIGPIFLIFLPLYFLGKMNRIVNTMFLISFLYLFSFLKTGIIRYSYFSIVLLSLSISYGILKVVDFRPLKFIVYSTFFAIVFLNSFLSFSHLSLVNPGHNLFLGKENKESYLKNYLPHYRGIEFINKNLPPDSLILFLYEARTAYIKRNFISATPYDTNILKHILREYDNPEDMIEEIKKRKITHLFLNEAEKERIEGKFDYLGIRNPEIRERFYSLLSRLKIIYSSAGIYIYSLF